MVARSLVALSPRAWSSASSTNAMPGKGKEPASTKSNKAIAGAVSTASSPDGTLTELTSCRVACSASWRYLARGRVR